LILDLTLHSSSFAAACKHEMKNVNQNEEREVRVFRNQEAVIDPPDEEQDGTAEPPPLSLLYPGQQPSRIRTQQDAERDKRLAAKAKRQVLQRGHNLIPFEESPAA